MSSATMDFYDHKWRTMRRICDVLLANLATELAAVADAADNNADINIAAPIANAYLVRGSREKLKQIRVNQGHSLIAIYPVGRTSYDELTGAPTGVPFDAFWGLGLAIYIAPEEGAAGISESWGALDYDGREFRRKEMFVGAVTNVLFGKAHDGLNINSIYDPQVAYDLTLGPADMRDDWAELTWSVYQRVYFPGRVVS